MSYARRRLTRDPLSLIGIVTIVSVTAAAIAAPWVSPYDPSEQFFHGLTLEGSPLPPSGQFLLGTDLLGRDLFSRLLYGARTSLIIGVVANGAAVTVGTLLGVIAGYVQGWIGATIMRFTDLMMAFPALLLAIALAAIFTPSLWIVAMVIALVNWVQIARVIYTETTGLVAREYIEAARGLGASWPRISSRRHRHGAVSSSKVSPIFCRRRGWCFSRASRS
jgi:peptide/nickel transport system permease protein